MKILRSKIAKYRLKIEKASLRKVLDVLSLYSIGYGNVGSSIYYALGIVAFYAAGATPLAFAVAGLFFLMTALAYAEGCCAIQEAGGSSSFIRKSLNEFLSFICAWILLLSYIVTISISSATAAFYLANIFPTLRQQELCVICGIFIILVLMVINIKGVKESAKVNIFFCLIDIFTQLALVIFGFIFLFYLPKFITEIKFNFPSFDKLILGCAIATVAYIGLESVAQMSEEVKNPKWDIPLAFYLTVATVFFMYFGIATIALSGVGINELLEKWQNDPVAGIAAKLPSSLSEIFLPWVGILAATILIIAANAGILGASRLAFSMGKYKQIPSFFYKLSPRFDTPYIGIAFFCLVASVLVFAGLFTKELLIKLGELYVFSAALAFAFAHLSILALRWQGKIPKEAIKTWGNIKIKEKSIPLSSLAGLIFCSFVFLMICVTREFGRYVGCLWLLFGILMYVCYRKKKKLSLLKTQGVEPLLKISFEKKRFKRIMVPITHSPFCEEAIEQACKIAKTDDSFLYIIHVLEVPMILELNDISDDKRKEAEALLERAKYIAETYKISAKTKLIIARQAASAIIQEAKKNKIDLIILFTGDKLRDELSFGKTVEFIIKNAPCRILTQI